MQGLEDQLVSIVTPAYKAARFVGETIESVIAQEFRNWELLVVDDCSPDNTAEVVRRYATADHRVRLIRLTQNGGAAMARNAALEAARGRFVAFLDSDDLWMPGKLQAQLAFMKDVNGALSFTSFRRITQDGERTGRLIPVPARLDFRGLLRNTAIATSTVVVDRSLTGSFRMKKTYYDDLALWLELLSRGFIAHGLPLDLVRYRVVEQSLSRNKLNSAYQVWRTYRDAARVSLVPAAWGFGHYAFRAWLKYRRF